METITLKVNTVTRKQPSFKAALNRKVYAAIRNNAVTHPYGVKRVKG